jgi:cellulose synthase operon protein C
MTTKRPVLRAMAFLVAVVALSVGRAWADDPAGAARRLLLAGKYEEAAEAYTALAETEPVAAAVGLARILVGTGRRDEVAPLLDKALTLHPRAAALHAEAARWALDRGQVATAQKAAAAALALDANQLQACWVTAELARMTGRLDEANQQYKFFVDFCNGHDVDDAESLGWIGLGAAQFARWNRLSDQFNFLVNDLYPAALELDPAWWPAHYYAGLLYLEKYNQAEASRELKAALLLNPNAAEVHAALARLAVQNFDLGSARRTVDRALELDPLNLEAHLVRGDTLLANFQAADAIAVFQEACRLHPASEAAQGRLAAAFAVVDGTPQEVAGTRLGALVERATTCNPCCGEFFFSLATGLDASRKFPQAACWFRQAIERMPQLIQPYGDLGIVLMRLGDEAEAKRQLDQAFAIDPFNVRVNNMLKVLGVLDTYAVFETEHFVIRFDRGRDEILARYAARYLEEEVYPELCQRFAYQPAEKSLFEIFNRAGNTPGHGWFSARMVGLPFVHTVGACAGKIVALTSPADMAKKFNWARVLKHEFVHVLNLQQTDFSVPHWFTEALAVGSEGSTRPSSWNELLAERVTKNELFNLDTINLAFVRPESSDDWQMAYCQADLYAQYMTATYGERALAKMLVAYRDNLDTPQALRRELGVEVDDFERGYLDFVRNRVAGLGRRAAASSETLAELERSYRADPSDALATARLAEAYLARSNYPRARALAESALTDARGRQLAAYVLARVHMVVGENRQAFALLEENLDRNSPDEHLLNLLAGLKFKAEQFDEAAALYELGARQNPAATAWLKSLAKVYLAERNDAKLAEVLAQLAALDADDLPMRKKLAELAHARGDVTAAKRWAREALYIDVMDPDVHRMLAEAHVAAGEFGPAVKEYEVAVVLDTKDAALELALAEACLKTDQRDRARQALEQVLKLEPANTHAAELLENLAR